MTSLWSWVYRYRQPVWIEDIKSKDLKKPAKNEATGEDIDPLYLNIFQDTDSIMAVPLIFRDVTWGIYSIELPISGKFTEEVLDVLERIAKSIALIIWKADTFELNQGQTANAIRLFTDSILEYGFQENLTPYRSGFIARPFTPEFNNLEACVTNFLEKRQIQARRYVYRQGTGIVIEDIMRQIRSSHFGIIDVTSLNPNVMVELGMFMVLRKKFLILRRQGDTTELPPFDIRSYHVVVSAAAIEIALPIY